MDPNENTQPTETETKSAQDEQEVNLDNETRVESTRKETEETRPTRESSKTAKGLEWQVGQLITNQKSATSRWRKRACAIETLLTDAKDASELRKNRELLNEAMHDIDLILERLTNTVVHTSGEVIQGYETILHEMRERHEIIETDHHALQKQITDTIKNIQYESTSQSSRVTRRSMSSRSSSRSADTIMEAAALKTKLKYIDLESKQKAELEKIQTLKKLDMAQSSIAALEASPLSYDELRDIPKVSPTAMVEEYLKNQRNVQVKIEPTVLDEKYGASAQPQLIPEHSEPYKTLSSKEETHDLPHSLPLNLNPDAHEFQPPPQIKKRDTLVPQRPPVPKADNILRTKPSRISEASIPADPIRHSDPCPETNSDRPVYSSPVSNNVELGLLELANSLAKQISLSRLPPPEPSIFLGDPLKYPSWKAAFQTLIEQRQIPASERIHYLKRYLGGQVKEVVESYFLMSSEDAYDEAKNLLDQRYGNAFVIAGAFRDKLESWPKISPKDGIALRQFADFLRQCNTAMHSIGSLNALNDVRENRKLLSKLPDWLLTRWGRIATQHREETNTYPPFTVFVDFIVKEAKIATDPVTSLQSLSSHRDSNRPQNDRPRATGQRHALSRDSRSFLTEVDEEQQADISLATTTARSNYRTNCTLCHGNHELDNCDEFMRKELSSRKQYAKEKGLCFGCLRPGHISKRCRQRKKCKTCSKSHPSSLHGDTVRSDNEKRNLPQLPVPTTHSASSSTLMSNSGASSKSSMILPVYLSHVSDPNNERLVYALLDTQSDTTFLLENTRKALAIPGNPVKLMLSTMYAENMLVDSCKVQGLAVRGFDSEERILLPETYTRDIMPANRLHIPTPEIARRWPHLEVIADQLLPLNDSEVGLLIGYNCSKALVPRDVIVPADDGPYGQRTDLGWGIVGIVDSCSPESDSKDPIGTSHRIVLRDVQVHSNPVTDSDTTKQVTFSIRNRIKEVINPKELTNMLELDFSEHYGNSRPLSHEDKQFLTAMKDGIHMKDGHYEMPLPFRSNSPNLPNNKEMAVQRLRHLRKKLIRDQQYHKHYVTFMNELISNGYAEKVPREEIDLNNGCEWYIPHHGVYHPQKPGKLRVVFDCSAKFLGQCLNENLLQGPDMMNLLCGVLCRFRKEHIAFVCDVEQMFHQFKVNVEHRDYLRFLWWKDGNLENDPQVYRMTVHLFGAVSSPGCANFALKQAATDGEDCFGSDVASFIRDDFYVDDGLKSVATAEEAISLITRSKELCCTSGLRLHKFLSNSKEVLEGIPTEDRAKGLTDINIHHDKLPTERTLGIQWCTESDSFQFKITPNDRPYTRRGVLSTLSSIYDPLGFIAPFILVGKQILQEMCKGQIDWDSPLPEHLYPKWRRWMEDLKNLGSLQIRRCLKPDGFGNVVTAELHHFSDASTVGYGQCSYLRLIDDQQRIHCSLVMAKSRVAPVRPVTIPRLELTAALVSVKVSSVLLEELAITKVTEWFWTDSNVVLGYISNDSRRFHVFVANRIQQIRDHSEPYQWNYVSSGENPADIASRGATADELRNSRLWFDGPSFLWTSKEPFQPHTNEKPTLVDNDPEVKRTQVLNTKVEYTESNNLLDQLERFSDWTMTKRVIARCLKFKLMLKHSEPLHSGSMKQLSVADLQEAETAIIRIVQRDAFKEEVPLLETKNEKG